ncbi:MAG: hypothetical protein PHN22_02385 [Candidatus ainarchaeum sp.]|nr:hypothetical protein [Candidatus ainarchaeum sp.]
MFLKKFLFFIICFLFLLSSLYSSDFNLNLNSTPDFKDNSLDIFYIPKSGFFQIFFDISSDLIPKDYFSPNKVVYSYKVFDLKNNNSYKNQIDLSISKNFEFLYSESISSFSLNLLSKGFNDQDLLIEVISEIYDSSNNLLEKDNSYIKLISNNSDIYYPDTIKKNEPLYRGHNISTDKIILYKNTNNDFFIKLFVENNFSYDVSCKINNDIYDNDFYITKDYNKELFKFNISLKNKNLDSGKFLILCNAFNKNNFYKLKDIELIYINANIFTDNNFSDINYSIENEDISVSSKKYHLFKEFFNNIFNSFK